MEKIKVFIDGKEGTTGLRIYERLSGRDELELLTLPEEKRKDAASRKEKLNECDLAFLCLPDDGAREAVSMVENPKVRIIDASTAHRTTAGWVYGFPELSKSQRNLIAASKRVAVTGCHASGFIATVAPLVKNGIIKADEDLSCFSLTGYSGGGKKMIAEYESDGRSVLFDSPRQYALGQSHKHLKEMQAITGLDNPPVFSPIVADFYSGMEVTVPLTKRQVNGLNASGVHKVLSEHYKDEKIVTVAPFGTDELGGLAAANTLSGKDVMRIYVFGNDDRMTLTALFDNLGKGASGAAIQCMNIMLGIDECKGLQL